MIKLPKKIVIYPQKNSKPDYLLCWIPTDGYKQVASNQEVQEELETDLTVLRERMGIEAAPVVEL